MSGHMFVQMHNTNKNVLFIRNLHSWIKECAVFVLTAEFAPFSGVSPPGSGNQTVTAEILSLFFGIWPVEKKKKGMHHRE